MEIPDVQGPSLVPGYLLVSVPPVVSGRPLPMCHLTTGVPLRVRDLPLGSLAAPVLIPPGWDKVAWGQVVASVYRGSEAQCGRPPESGCAEGVVYCPCWVASGSSLW